MRYVVPFGAMMVAGAVLAGAVWWSVGPAEPIALAVSDPTETMILVEHNEFSTTIDPTGDGASAGDVIVWGPNPLYASDNAEEAAAHTQGVCTAVHDDVSCVLVETIVFPNGSTLQFQGIELANALPSTRTIVGGSGDYLGATGTAFVEPTEDETIWKRTIEFAVPGE